MELGSVIVAVVTILAFWARMEHRFTVLEERDRAMKDRLDDYGARIHRLERQI